MFDQPFVRPSRIQRIDPRVRMAFAGGLAVCISLLHSLTACGMALALGLALLAAANPPARALLQRLGAINIFICFSVVRHTPDHAGDTAGAMGSAHSER